MIRLEVYIEWDCLVCRRSLRLAEHVRQRFPTVDVRIVNVTTERGEHSDLVIATPTFILNGRIFSLGNPSQADLDAAIAALLTQGG